MNLENIARLVAAIKEEISGFDMDSWRQKTDCGTVACIGGHCEILMGKTLEDTRSLEDAADWLGLRKATAKELFYPRLLKYWHLITREDAIKAINNVAEHGEPRWAEIRPDLAKERMW